VLTKALSSLIRKLLPDQQGNVALIVAAVFPLLIGAAGLAVDGTEWVLQKRQIQAATDSAAMAGVYSLIAEQDMQNAVSNTLSRDGSVPADASIQAEQSPAGHETDPFAVAVHVAVPARMTFSSMFMKHAPVITAEATASVVQNGEYCAFALGDADDSGVVIRPNSNVEMECGVASNSTGRAAVQADQSSSLQSSAIVAYGAIDGKGAIHDSIVRPHSLAQKDPLEDSDPPLVPNTGCPRATVNPDNGAETALDPGCYGDMILNGNVRLQDGEYILNRGNFVVGPQAHVSCDACTIFLTSDTAATDPGSIGKVKMSSEATVKMNATREGPNAGILFYQDRHAARDLPGDENRVGGSSFSILKGILYFPSETLYLDGNMSPDLQCARLLAKRLVFAGRVYISKKCGGPGGRTTFEGTEVRLIS
jgi:putative Flp pilus-assembly TadE/G-like protein